MMQHSVINQIEKNWKVRIIFKTILWSLIILLFTLGLIQVTSISPFIFLISVILIVTISILEWRKKPLQADLVTLVNQQFESTEYSTELIFDESATGLVSLQRERVLGVLKQEIPSFKYPVSWQPLMWTSLVLMMVFLGAWSIPVQQQSTNASFEGSQQFSAVVSKEKDTIFLKNANVRISPPSYTGLRTSQFDDLNLDVPAQSSVQWTSVFEGVPDAVWIRTSQGDSLSFKKKNQNWKTNFRPKVNGFYTLNYSSKNTTTTSPYFQLQLIADEAPEVKITGIPQHQRIDFRKGLSIDFNIQLSDDYGLTDGYVVATITKGAGESVMFREQQIPFTSGIRGKNWITKLSLKPDDFGMEPGNELYFYATAFDNRTPKVQQSRTETYFFILKDTAQVEFSLQGSLGVDLMPDFFRSQLQIILDTEKLLKDKRSLDKHSFDETSNELGFDQKQLRLKYGQFIGEEDESGLDIEQEAPEEVGEVNADGSNVLQEFGHDHDHENEAGQLMDKGTEPAAETDTKNPLQAYMHEHGDEETATFHTQSLKSKLKAALSEMWDAELYLRLFQPEQSLPYQYRAQELLKEIKNHARIYVQRIGFDPPTVNEAESRLTGKMKQLNEGTFKEKQEDEQEYTAIRKGIAVLDGVLLSKEWNEEIRKDMQATGDELAGLAIEQPGDYLEALNVLKILLDKSTLQKEDFVAIKSLKTALGKAIKKANPIPARDNHSLDEMNAHFLNNLLKANGSR